MKPASAKARFLRILQEKQLRLSSLSPASGIALMLSFFRDERADGCAIEEDRDKLMYQWDQWGSYDWGRGDFFELKITREFIDGSAEKEAGQRLSLTFKFKPTRSLRDLGNGRRWCYCPAEIEEFRSFIESSPPFKTVADTKPAKVTLTFHLGWGQS